MGTPDFAVSSLKAIHLAGFDIVGVITATDKYGGRGRKQLIESPVKQEALKLGLHVLQPPRLKARSFIKELRALKADIQFVVAFRMLPVIVWDMPRLGTYNIHGSLLPKYRGAAPIHWAVIHGESVTGVTAFKLKHEIDTGSLIAQRQMSIGPNETTGEVYNRMKLLGSQLAIDTLNMIQNDDYQLIDQEETEASHAPKIYHETCEIDFNRSTDDVHNFIRGLSPFPLAWTKVGEMEIKIMKAAKSDETSIPPGHWKTDNKTYLLIGTADSSMSILKLKIAGKRAMSITDLLNGQDVRKWQDQHAIIIDNID
ncbi:UNVERIFIED_CONTAM: hypothetical protein GTU68_009530 [Idotea baltica]|nr:hypothetical protein [Idotea baltica]